MGRALFVITVSIILTNIPSLYIMLSLPIFCKRHLSLTYFWEWPAFCNFLWISSESWSDVLFPLCCLVYQFHVNFCFFTHSLKRNGFCKVEIVNKEALWFLFGSVNSMLIFMEESLSVILTYCKVLNIWSVSTWSRFDASGCNSILCPKFGPLILWTRKVQ